MFNRPKLVSILIVVCWCVCKANFSGSRSPKPYKEICVDTLHKRALIFAALRYSKLSKGRALRCDLPDLLLCKGDRLEPGGDLLNSSEFEQKPLPFTIVLWRAGKEQHLVHASPLWTLRGISVSHFTVDLLHSWHLGGCLTFTAAVFWHVLDCGIWSPNAVGFSKEEKAKMALMILRQKMWQYYKQREQTDAAFKTKGSRAPTKSSSRCQFRHHGSVFLCSCCEFE